MGKNNNLRTIVYAGNYEKVTENGTVREFYYLDGNTIVVRENGNENYFLAFTDNIGSILSVMDENGARVFNATYDAWGNQTVRLNTIGLRRGYTGHEMLNKFEIIYMNQRSLSRSGEVTAACTIPLPTGSSAPTTMCRCQATARASTGTATARTIR